MTVLNQFVNVIHGSADLTSFVISYERSQKMCTGVDSLSMSLTPNHGQSFKPWDVIKIFEAGNLKGTYYLNDGGIQQPDGSFYLNGQDNSKRLVDYFITDTYLIDYPSYSRYWIETFLDEVGIDYDFTTDSDGSLLSNNTSLGLMGAYEQIMYLLQISGWYLYFDEQGTAIIGEIDPDLSNPKGSFQLGELTGGKVVQHDKMLRNRAVVWGANDPVTSVWIFSDVSTVTPWNYDDKDLRAVVMSNSNIPTQEDADEIAMEMLDTFAQITVEKHIELPEEKGWSIGDPIRGMGGICIVTTRGAHFSAKTGYRSDFIFDERCPRLWAYFNFGGHVYVGTETSGVYRKHILWDTVWSGYSSGLPESDWGISDLFVRNELATIVTLSGNTYYTACSGDFSSWSGIVIPPLETFDASGVPYIVESGIRARATIHDKISNNIRLLVDTYSGFNYPGYFELLSGYISQASGILSSGNTVPTLSGCRTWVLDYLTSGVFVPSGESFDLFGSDISSGVTLVSSYPVYFPSGFFEEGFSGVSPIWDCRGIDIENDGKYDYVSIVSPPQQVLIGDWLEVFHRRGSQTMPSTPPWYVPYHGVVAIYISFTSYPTLTITTLQEIFTLGGGAHCWAEIPRTYLALPSLVFENHQPVAYEVESASVIYVSPWRSIWSSIGLPPAPTFNPNVFIADETGVSGWAGVGVYARQDDNLYPHPYYGVPFYYAYTIYWVIPFYNTPISGNICSVLRRDGEEFTLVTSGMYPYRLDVSSVSPLVVVQDLGTSFNTFYNSSSGDIVQYVPDPETSSGLFTTIWDYRYSAFSQQASGLDSGSAVVSGKYKNIIFTTKGGVETPMGIYLTPTNTYTDVKDVSILTSGIPVVLSGVVEMIETSNHAFPNQYVFVSTSGEPFEGMILEGGITCSSYYRFYQKNPSGVYTSGTPSGLATGMATDFGFNEFSSGLPYSRITIIRLEDII